MTDRWNPNAPNLVGLEVASPAVQTYFVDSAAAMLAHRWNAVEGYVVERLYPYLDFGCSSPAIETSYPPVVMRRPIMVDIVPRAAEGAGALSFFTFPANRVENIEGDWRDYLTGTPMADASGLVTAYDAALTVSTTQGAQFVVGFDTSTMPDGYQILGVGLNMTISNVAGGSGARLMRKTLMNEVGGWHSTPPSLNPTDVWPEFFASIGDSKWTWWTPAEIRQFAAAPGGLIRRFQITNLTPTGIPLVIDQLQLFVYAVPERRMAVGVFTPVGETGVLPNWQHVDLLIPDKSLLFTPTYLGDHTTIFRRGYPCSFDSSADATLALRTIQGAAPFPEHEFRRATLTTNSQPAALGPPEQAMPAIRYRNETANIEIATGQPYAAGYGVSVYDGAIAGAAQGLSGANGTYGVMFLVVSTDFGPTADLEVSIVRVSDNAVMGSGRLTVEDAETHPTFSSTYGGSEIDSSGSPIKQYRRAIVVLDSAAVLAPGVAYFAAILSDTDSAHPWLVAALLSNDDAAPQHISYGTETADGFGFFWVGGALASMGPPSFFQGDLLATIGIQPPAPAGFTGEQAIQHTSGGASGFGGCETAGSGSSFSDDFHDTFDGAPGSANDCFVQRIFIASLAWSATLLAGEFAYYEVQRRDAYTDWHSIAHVTSEATTRFDDFEARIGVTAEYRLRVMRADGVPSAWTASAFVAIDGERAELVFVTNEKPSRNIGYPDYYEQTPERDFKFPEAAEVVTKPLYGRDFQVAFRPAERRGVSFTRQLMVDKRVTRTPPTLDVFAPLRDIAWDTDLSYVCVKDTEGNRWFASLTVPDAFIRGRSTSDLYSASIGVIEVTDSPSTPTASAPVA